MSYNHLSPNTSDNNDNRADPSNELTNNETQMTFQQAPQPNYSDQVFPGNYQMNTAIQIPFQRPMPYTDPSPQEFPYISPTSSSQYIPHQSPSTSAYSSMSSQKPIQMGYSSTVPPQLPDNTGAVNNAERKKRPRRKFHEVERIYVCNFPGCTKAYGTLNHLNSHIIMQKHGSKRFPEEFKEIRDIRRQERKRRKHEAKKLGLDLTQKKKSNSISTIPTSKQDFDPLMMSNRAFANSQLSQSLPLSYNQPGFPFNPSLPFNQPPSFDQSSFSSSTASSSTVPQEYQKGTEAYTGLVANTTFIPAQYNNNTILGQQSYNNNTLQMPLSYPQQQQIPPQLQPGHHHNIPTRLPTLQEQDPMHNENNSGGNMLLVPQASPYFNPVTQQQQQPTTNEGAYLPHSHSFAQQQQHRHHHQSQQQQHHHPNSNQSASNNYQLYK